jgi:hypothetical protein
MNFHPLVTYYIFSISLTYYTKNFILIMGLSYIILIIDLVNIVYYNCISILYRRYADVIVFNNDLLSWFIYI